MTPTGKSFRFVRAGWRVRDARSIAVTYVNLQDDVVRRRRRLLLLLRARWLELGSLKYIEFFHQSHLSSKHLYEAKLFLNERSGVFRSLVCENKKRQ